MAGDDAPPIILRDTKALARYQMQVVGTRWFQDDWLAQANGSGTRDNPAQIYTFVKARRVGGSESVAIRSIGMALGRRIIFEDEDPRVRDGDVIMLPPMPGNMISKDYAGAKELITKIVENVRELAELTGDRDCIAALPYCHQTSVFFPTTGMKIEALAATPRSLRGKTGFVMFDEFPFARDQEEMWAAGSLIAKANFKCEGGYPLMAIGTPWEAGSFAHRIFTDDSFPFRKNRYSVDIFQAVKDGFPIDPQQAFLELGIPELVETEYLCKWSRGGESFFSPDKLRAITVDDGDDENRELWLPDDYASAPTRIGIDCGGGVGSDFTAAVMFKKLKGKWTMVGLIASNSTPTVEMAERVGSWLLDTSVVEKTVHLEIRCDRGVMGADFIEALGKVLRDRQRTSVIGVGMTLQEQERYAVGARKLLERGLLAIYMGDHVVVGHAIGDIGNMNGAHALKLELSRIKARRGAGGHVTFTTPRDPLRGHCDRAWAALMALEGVADNEGYHQLSTKILHQLYSGEDSRWGNMSDQRGFG